MDQDDDPTDEGEEKDVFQALVGDLQGQDGQVSML